MVTEAASPVKLRGVMVDVTDRKKAEEELRKREEHFRLLIENASDLITVINNEGVFRFQSPSAVRMLGYRPEEMIGRSIFEYLHPEDAPRIAPAIQRAVVNPGLPVSVEYRFRHQDGSWRLHPIGGAQHSRGNSGGISSSSIPAMPRRRASWRNNSGNRRRWKPSGNWPAAWRTI
jgi:PAS domain S-box-containing protein